jgi:predicted alpha/beta hydrolase family esterase
VVHVLSVPGIGNSGAAHWQTLWEAKYPEVTRVVQRDWDNPDCNEWADVLEAAVLKSRAETVLVAHSLACLVVARWAAHTSLSIRGAMLVAVPDPTGSNFPPEVRGFLPVSKNRFSFSSMVVESSDDPYGNPGFTRKCARAWGSRIVNIGSAGHINASSGLDEWNEGVGLLETLMVSKETRA